MRYDIWSIAADGSGLAQLTRGVGTAANTPHWSPDGSAIAFPDEKGSYLYPLGGRGGEKSRALPPFEGGGFNATSWSPDGKFLGGEVRRGERFLPGLVLYSFERSAYERVTDRGDQWVWHPDGRRLFFVDAGRIFLLDRGSGRVTEIAPAPPNSPNEERVLAVSKDGRQLYLVDNSTEADIWQLRLP